MRTPALGMGLFLSVAVGCSQKNGSTDATSPQSLALSESESLLMATIDPLATPWRANILSLDLSNLVTQTLLTGESGDPAFFKAGSETLLFNRSQDSRNVRSLTKTGSQSFQAAEQKAFAGGEFGDPHDALDLGNGLLLLAHYTEGALVVVDKTSGEQVSRVEADWDLPADVSFKPEALVAFGEPSKRKIYVIHQALSLSDGLISANGSQQVFVLAQEGSSLRAVDINPAAPKVQGIKVKGSFPLPVRFQKREKLLLVSMCSRYIAMGSSLLGRTCDSAVEEIDPTTDSAALLWDLNGSAYFMNGPVVPGPSSTSFFANVDIRAEGETFSQAIAVFDIAPRTVSKVYDFPKESGGFWATAFDEASQTLYVGDKSPSGGGQVTIIPIARSGEKQVVTLGGAPYAATLIQR